MVKAYLILFKGIEKTKEEFMRRMSQLGVPLVTIEELLNRAPLIIRRDLTLREARQYADAIQEAGGRITIKTHGHLEELKHTDTSASVPSFQKFTMCHECGLKQPKAETCTKCGSVLKK